jgi:FkbM family methyltransferase
MIPYFNERGQVIDITKCEVDEQRLAREYVPKNARVLELGARYGTVSCIISSILDDPTKHVAVEPDISVAAALIHNKLTHNSKFNIVFGAISRTPLFLDFTCGYGNHTIPSDRSTIETFTLEEIEKRYDVTFDCLVADCEGFLEQFFRENPTFALKLNIVIFEMDCPERCNYDFVKQVLRDAGLHPVIDEFQSVWVR